MNHQAQTEIHILGTMLLDKRGFELCEGLDVADFTLDSHRRLYSRMLAMKATGLEVTEGALLSELARLKELETVGGAEYVMDLTMGLIRGMSPESLFTIFCVGVRREYPGVYMLVVLWLVDVKDGAQEALSE